MNTWAIYKVGTGEIVRILTVPSNGLQGNIGGGEEATLIDGRKTVSDKTHRVEFVRGERRIVQKTKMALSVINGSIRADGIDELKILGIPENSKVSLGKHKQDVVGDSVEFSVDLAGTYKLNFKNSLYLDTEVTIEATT